jgi:hypothetical protein
MHRPTVFLNTTMSGNPACVYQVSSGRVFVWFLFSFVSVVEFRLHHVYKPRVDDAGADASSGRTTEGDLRQGVVEGEATSHQAEEVPQVQGTIGDGGGGGGGGQEAATGPQAMLFAVWSGRRPVLQRGTLSPLASASIGLGDPVHPRKQRCFSTPPLLG